MLVLCRERYRETAYRIKDNFRTKPFFMYAYFIVLLYVMYKLTEPITKFKGYHFTLILSIKLI